MAVYNPYILKARVTMTEFSKKFTFDRPLRATRYAAAAGVLLLTAVTENSCSTGGDVVRQVSTIVRTAPMGGRLVLDCAAYYEMNSDGQRVPDPSKGGPRMLLFSSDKPGTTWAGDVSVQYGYETYNQDGTVDPDETHTTLYDYWLAQNNTGDLTTSKYASANGSLPSNDSWQEQLQLLPRAVRRDGAEMPNIGKNPFGDGTQIVVAKTAASLEKDIAGPEDEEVFSDPTGFGVECRDAVGNQVASSEVRITPDQLQVIHVTQTFESVPPAQS